VKSLEKKKMKKKRKRRHGETNVPKLMKKKGK